MRGSLVVVSLLLACGVDRVRSDAGEETTGASTETTSSESSGRESNGTDSTTTTTLPTSTSASTDDPDDDDTSQADQCDLSEDDCPPGTACCQASFADPMLCEPVPPGGCGGDVECPAGLECFAGSHHCGIGECVPRVDDTTDTSSSDTTASTEGGSSTG